MKRALVVAWTLAVALSTSVAAASDPDARAEQLFGEGRAAMQARDWTKALGLLEESQRLDPASGTLLNLAVCHAELGRTATAYRLFGEALFSAEQRGDVEQADLARERREALVARLATVRVTTKGEADVAIDGVRIAGAMLANDVPIDPGRHVLVARHRSGRTFELAFDAAEGSRRAIDVPADAAPPGARDVVEPSSGWSSMRVAGAATVSASVLALGLATYFTVRALDLRAESDDACPNDRCTPDGVASNERARASGDRATAFAIGGAVGLGIGTVLYLVGRRPTGRIDALAW